MNLSAETFGMPAAAVLQEIGDAAAGNRFSQFPFKTGLIRDVFENLHPQQGFIALFHDPPLHPGLALNRIEQVFNSNGAGAGLGGINPVINVIGPVHVQLIR